MTTPRLAIGLYVYNGERHIVAAIDSLLSQTMTDFALDISDNASTDLTEEICRSYAAADPRVRYVRHEENRGPTWNFNFVEKASPDTDLYKWCAHDDIYEPTYLERCVAELDERPEVVACHTQVRYINDNGDELMRSFRQMDFTDDRPWVRLNQILLRPHDHSHGFAVMRRSALARVRPFQSVFKGDAILLCELVLLGPFGEIQEHLFANRMHPTRSTAAISRGRIPQVWAELFGGSKKFPMWRTLASLEQGISSSPLGPVDKARCYAVLAKWARGEWGGLALDLATDGTHSVSERVEAGWQRARAR
jgi:glycosyltransferase involved in cell wall biosynthesis